MKKKILFVLIAVLTGRLIVLFYFKEDPFFILSPRNFNGRGLLTAPTLADFIIPFLVLPLLPENWSKNIHFSIKGMRPALLPAVLLVLTPIITGILLFPYLEKTLVTFEISRSLLFRYLLFVLTFPALQLFIDRLSMPTGIFRTSVLILFFLAMAGTQDLFITAGASYILLGMLSSPGISLVFLAIVLRKPYRTHPLETIAVAALAGIFYIFFLLNALSVSFATVFLPFLAVLSMTIVLSRTRRRLPKVIIGASPFLLALFLSFVLPSLLPPETAEKLIERKKEGEFLKTQVGGVTVEYPSDEFRDIAKGFGKVIDAANRVSEKTFGFSPHVTDLVIKGFGPGGFHAEFPGRIVGRIMSETYLKHCRDSVFLNDTLLPADFPDPVNAILHEYSHLYGVIPYYRWWPGAEEEGWATFSATVLSGLLYEQDKRLWYPAYNYSRQARKITRQNLSGKAVVWSHPNEYGGFNLWYQAGKKYGIPGMYRLRRECSIRNIQGSLYIPSNPALALKAVVLFGEDLFRKYGYLPRQPLGKIYSRKDFLYLATATGMDKEMILRMYDRMKNLPIDPSVPIPVSN